MQNAIYRAGLRATSVDLALVRERYLEMQYQVACTVAEQEGRVVGFQSLKQAWPGHPSGVAEGWGIIGTHIHPDVGRSGLGRRLFASSPAAAKTAGLRHIDASIGVDNETCPGLLLGHGLQAVPRGRRHDPAPVRRRVAPP